jgi:hypothetical protein
MRALAAVLVGAIVVSGCATQESSGAAMTTVLDTRIADQVVRVERSQAGDRICVRIETRGEDYERCAPREGPNGDQTWFASEVASGHWVVLQAVVSSDPYFKLRRVEATTTDGRTFEADAIADGAVVFVAVDGELDRTKIWNTSGNLVSEAWSPFWDPCGLACR